MRTCMSRCSRSTINRPRRMDGCVFATSCATSNSRLHLAKCFRRRLVEVPGDTDHPYWIEDKNFDLEFHVRHVALPPPGDWTQFCRQAARLHSYPLDRSKPLWELTVISGLRAIDGVPDGAFGLLLKIHHAAIDGASGAALTEVLHDLQATPGEIPPPQTVWSGEPEPAPFDLMSRSALNNLLQPFRAAEVWSRTVPALRRAAETFRATPVDPVGPVPRTRFNGRVTPHRVFDGRRYALEDCRRIKRAVEGATINDVILTVVGGALRRYLDREGRTAGHVVDCDGADQRAHDGREKHRGQQSRGDARVVGYAYRAASRAARGGARQHTQLEVVRECDRCAVDDRLQPVHSRATRRVGSAALHEQPAWRSAAPRPSTVS